MLEITENDYRDIIRKLVYSEEIISLVRDYRGQSDAIYSVLNDISMGKDSGNYDLIKRSALELDVNADFVVSIASFLMSGRERYDKDYYSILGVSRDASTAEIRDSWIGLMKRNHPDLIGEHGIQKSKELNEAYEILSNDKKRAGYDESYFRTADVIVVSNLKKHRNTILTFMILLFFGVFVLISSVYTDHNNVTADNPDKGQVDKEHVVNNKGE